MDQKDLSPDSSLFLDTLLRSLHVTSRWQDLERYQTNLENKKKRNAVCLAPRILPNRLWGEKIPDFLTISQYFSHTVELRLCIDVMGEFQHPTWESFHFCPISSKDSWMRFLDTIGCRTEFHWVSRSPACGNDLLSRMFSIAFKGISSFWGMATRLLGPGLPAGKSCGFPTKEWLTKGSHTDWEIPKPGI